MYSGLAMTKYSGRVMGAHQQIDRIARRRLEELLNKTQNKQFPKFKEIVLFEGRNGPDGIKLKSPAQNEPWHFMDPLEHENEEYLKLIRNHYDLLVKSLKEDNRERASFEAAWLSHAVVDGMTPAHHYPYEAEIEELRGAGRDSRNSKLKKVYFKGETASETVANMFKVYGPRGLFTAHHLFEFGVMLLLRPLRLPDARPTDSDLEMLAEIGPEKYFLNSAREVAALDLYEEYLADGWTAALSNKIRHSLAPTIVKTVTLLWYGAASEAKKK